jgi:hypothetical protein
MQPKRPLELLSTTSQAQGTTAPPTELSKEILLALESASLNRWANRREHEWKLNYAFWAVLAGLIVLAVDHKIHLLLSPAAVACAFGIVLLLQLAYLVPVTDRAIHEIEMQAEVELALQQMDPYVVRSVTDAHLGAAMKKRKWLDKHYGILAPLGVSLALMAVAWSLLFSRVTSVALFD